MVGALQEEGMTILGRNPSFGNRAPCYTEGISGIRSLMLILYMRPGCPYCAKVFRVAEALGVAFDERNINDPAINAELLARGGKRQVPYLVDPERGIEMYESEDIIAHLHASFTGKT